MFIANGTLSPSIFFLIKETSTLENIGTLDFAKCESASQCRHSSLSSAGHQSGHKSAKGVDPVRDCQKASQRVKRGRYSLLVLSQAWLQS